MADETKFTQADIDAAVSKAIEKVQGSVEALETKNAELIAEVRDAKAKARKGSEIKPEDLQAAEDRAEKAEAALAEANKALKTATTERDKALKSLETEQGAARTYALDAEINSAIAKGNVVPALVPALTAMVRSTAKADLVEGKYAVTVGDKPAGEYISTFLASEEGKHFVTAPVNGGGGAGGGGGKGGAKTMLRSEFEAMGQSERATFAKEGGKVVDAAA